MKRKYESELLQVIHEEMMDMHKSGFISDAEMKEYDKDCLIQEPETPKEAENSPKIKRITTKKATVNRALT